MENEMMMTLMNIAPIAIMVLIFYFILYRPQKKAQRVHEEMLNNLKIGTKVVTIGGIFGTITTIGKESVRLKIAERVEIDIARNSISRIADK